MAVAATLAAGYVAPGPLRSAMRPGGQPSARKSTMTRTVLPVRCGRWLFDVNAAAQLLERSPRPAVSLPVAPWIRGLVPLLGQLPPTVAAERAGINTAYAMTTADLTVPLVAAAVSGDDVPGLPADLAGVFPWTEAGDLLVLIDGRHRAWRAHITGMPELPVYVLTETETLAIRGSVDAPPARSSAECCGPVAH